MRLATILLLLGVLGLAAFVLAVNLMLTALLGVLSGVPLVWA